MLSDTSPEITGGGDLSINPSSPESDDGMKHFPTDGVLSTDVIEKEHNVKLRAHVLRHVPEMREVHIEDEQGVSWTYALTFFPEKHANPEIEEIDKEIQKGGLIGKVFRDHGYVIRKNVIGVRSVKLPDHVKKAFGVASDFAKARLSEFYAKKEGEDPIIYGQVLEIYTTKFRPAVVNETDMAQVHPTTAALEAVGMSRKEVWDRLPPGSNWDDINEKYPAAREASLGQVHELNARVDEYIGSHQ